MGAVCAKPSPLRSGPTVKEDAKPLITDAETSEGLKKGVNGWPPVTEFGWYASHSAIRKDLTDVKAVLDRMIAAPAVEEWEYEHLKAFWKIVTEYIHGHHDIEEQIVFPFLQEKLTLPQRLTTDHKTLMEYMAEATAKVDEAADQAGLKVARTAINKLDGHMRPHLLEEEEDVVPLLYKYYTADEFKPVTNQIIAHQAWWELGHYLRPYGPGANNPEKTNHVLNGLQVPYLVWLLILKPRLAWYERYYGYLIEELMDPELKKARESTLQYRVLHCACF